ncbi:hypothetical protein LI328DRAFT_153471 [Trichoderma asperelloides]|nr:hypothetical protein LI328DRAFT_153471 [Trichoderma asperelloides]
MKPAAWYMAWTRPSGACWWGGLWFFWARSNLHFYVSPSLARFVALPCLALPRLSRPLPTHPSVSGTWAGCWSHHPRDTKACLFSPLPSLRLPLRLPGTVRLYLLSASSFSPSAVAWAIEHPVPRRQHRSYLRKAAARRPPSSPRLLSIPSRPQHTCYASERQSKHRPTFNHLLARYEKKKRKITESSGEV